MKLEGYVPIPSLSGTLLPAIGRAPREVVMHGSRNWKSRIAAPPIKRKNTHHCGACGESGHNRASRKCPARPAP